MQDFSYQICQVDFPAVKGYASRSYLPSWKAVTYKLRADKEELEAKAA